MKPSSAAAVPANGYVVALKPPKTARLTYLQVQEQLVEAQHEFDVQTEKRGETAQASLQQQRMQAEAEYRKGLYADLAKAELSAKEHEEDLAKAVQRALRTLRATVDGTVQQLAVIRWAGS